MTAMELQQWKKNFIEKYIDEIDSIEMMAKLEKYAKRILSAKRTPSPIVFTVAEASIEIDLAEKELSEGKGINEENMHQFFEKWRKDLQ